MPASRRQSCACGTPVGRTAGGGRDPGTERWRRRDPAPTRSPRLEVGSAGTEDFLVPLRSRRRPWWALVSIALGVLWMLFCACLYVTGYTATATVTGSTGDGFCRVDWEDLSGSPHSHEVECEGRGIGDRLDVRVTGWPDAGEPTPPSAFLGMGVLLGLPLVAAGGARLLHLRRWGPGVPVPYLATPEALPGGHDAASLDRTGAALTRSARRAGGLLGLASLAACAAAVLLVVLEREDRELRDTGITTVGTILRVDPDSRFDPGGAAVEFTAGGTTRARYAWLGDAAYDYVDGQVVDVVYDRLDPDRFAVDDVAYGTGWAYWPAIAAAVAAVTAGPCGLAVLGTHRRIRRLLRQRAWTPTRVRVLSDGDGRIRFTGPAGELWRSDGDAEWPVISRAPVDRAGWGLPGEDDEPEDQSAWWVCDGLRAVFSPDRGAPLVLARRVTTAASTARR